MLSDKLACHTIHSTNNVDWKYNVDSRLDELTSLPQNWDGYSGAPTTSLAATRCKSILGTVMTKLKNPINPVIVPTNDGGLQVEWHRAHCDLELTIDGSSGDYELYIKAGLFFDGKNGCGGTNFEHESHGERAYEMFLDFAAKIANPNIDQLSISKA